MVNFKTFDWEGLLIDAGVKALEIIGILIAFVIVKKIGSKVLDRTFLNISKRKNISEGRALTLHKLAENILSYSLIFILAASLFNAFGLPVASLIAGAGVVGLAIGFGAQGLVSDVVTGFFLLLEKQLDVNDYVTIGNIDGVVEAVGLRTTQLRSFDGTLNFIPNRDILTVRNHSRGSMRALVDIGIAYDEDIDHAIEVTQAVCDQMAAENPVIVEGPNVIGVQALGASDVVLRVIAKTENGEQWAVERDIRKAIKAAFDENGIEIPYPHQVMVHKNEQNLGKSRGNE
ncbi:mechanosensitive ion channel family protein [Cytobacillus solani]|uniref:Mechanosensitive ion channel protein n=1 Tax=Cytobacillus solani TaxID=1637975 RepID=A0A0Q3QKI6_9BACI|nr:mechanosensitive ion channel family protein [Cytobacillus solani]KOP70955.1 mechanosensitive ion channel protein [Bacillus sp. FJAT-21945]KQL18096.1 mechanosensitive ion channel protein [Cytobacillus solani]USK55932.1 mechanosensitive ion channel family protein [Cytobacillus solani]